MKTTKIETAGWRGKTPPKSVRIWIERDGNEIVGEFPTLETALAHARKIKLTGYVFKGADVNDMESWRYFEGRCTDRPYGRANRSEKHR